jgi:hypothetical protein
MILSAKVRIFMIPYILSMSLIAIILFLNTLISPYLVFIPLCQITSAFAVGSFICGGVFKWRGGGRAVGFNPAGDQVVILVVLVLSALVGGIPLAGYGVTLLLSGDHLLSVFVQMVVAICESTAAWYLVPRFLKD